MTAGSATSGGLYQSNDMYDYSSAAIAGVLFAALLVSIEAGYRFGIAAEPKASTASRTQVSTVQASMLGLLALLVGFTFSLSLQRFDSRSEAVIGSANAIGTAYLRAQLLPESVREPTRDLIRTYVALRVKAGAISLDQKEALAPLLKEAEATLDELWRYALRAAEEDGRPVTSGLYVQSLNDVIDAFGKRDAALDRHVPELVLLLLFGTFLMTGALVGYASGIGGSRASFATYILVGLIVLMVFVIVDLDRPRRGMIKVSQASLTELHATMASDRR